MTRTALVVASLTLVVALAVYDWRSKRHKGWVRGLIAGVLVGLAVSHPFRAVPQPKEDEPQ